MALHANSRKGWIETSTQKATERLYLALYLPRWATDCLKRHNRTLASSNIPLVLYERQKGAMRLQALDMAAEEAGLYRGQNLSDARALCPELNAQEIDRASLGALFENFADWHTYASPIVSIASTDDPGGNVLAKTGRDSSDARISFGDLVLDIKGVSHLFGGEEGMLEHVLGRLKRAGFCVQGAIAPTVGGAWALARFAPGIVVDAGGLKTYLAGLPVSALRLDEKLVFGLEQMGLKTIGHLYGRDRKALRARFGDGLIRRFDQAFGVLEERLVPRLPVPQYQVERRFGEPIAFESDILMCADDLAVELCGQLEAEGVGAQSFHLLLFRVDYQVMHLAVNAARPIRVPDHIARLFANRIGRLAGEFDAGFGIEAIRLTASSVSPLEAHQDGVFELADGAEDLDRLYERMAARLGPRALLRSKPANSHLPERAVVLEPVIARTPDDPEALASFEGGDVVSEPGRDLFFRPLRLLPKPEHIQVMAEVPDGPPVRMVWRRLSYRLVKASGPERIGVEWWLPGSGALSRDYYRIEDEEGRRFWIFREGLYGSETGNPGWFMHGFDA